MGSLQEGAGQHHTTHQYPFAYPLVMCRYRIAGENESLTSGKLTKKRSSYGTFNSNGSTLCKFN